MTLEIDGASHFVRSIVIHEHFGIYTVSRKKVTSCIHYHNSDKQCQILTEFWTNNAMSNCKHITKFK